MKKKMILTFCALFLVSILTGCSEENYNSTEKINSISSESKEENLISDPEASFEEETNNLLKPNANSSFSEAESDLKNNDMGLPQIDPEEENAEIQNKAERENDNAYSETKPSKENTPENNVLTEESESISSINTPQEQNPSKNEIVEDETTENALSDPDRRGNLKAISNSYCKQIFDEVNIIRTSQGYSKANWDNELSGKAQSWATSLINESIEKNQYIHYHDNNRDSSEGIFWITDGKTSAKTIANEILSHCPACISTSDVIGIGGAVWQSCPIGDDMGFIVVRFYS